MGLSSIDTCVEDTGAWSGHTFAQVYIDVPMQSACVVDYGGKFTASVTTTYQKTEQ
jgi:hypothetical protein